MNSVLCRVTFGHSYMYCTKCTMSFRSEARQLPHFDESMCHHTDDRAYELVCLFTDEYIDSLKFPPFNITKMNFDLEEEEKKEQMKLALM